MELQARVLVASLAVAVFATTLNAWSGPTPVTAAARAQRDDARHTDERPDCDGRHGSDLGHHASAHARGCTDEPDSSSPALHVQVRLTLRAAAAPPAHGAAPSPATSTSAASPVQLSARRSAAPEPTRSLSTRLPEQARRGATKEASRPRTMTPAALLLPLAGTPPLIAAPKVPVVPSAVVGGLALGMMGLVAGGALIVMMLARRRV